MENLDLLHISNFVAKGVKSYSNTVKRGYNWAINKALKDNNNPVVQNTAVFAVSIVAGAADIIPLLLMVNGAAIGVNKLLNKE